MNSFDLQNCFIKVAVVPDRVVAQWLRHDTLNPMTWVRIQVSALSFFSFFQPLFIAMKVAVASGRVVAQWLRHETLNPMTWVQIQVSALSVSLFFSFFLTFFLLLF